MNMIKQSLLEVTFLSFIYTNLANTLFATMASKIEQSVGQIPFNIYKRIKVHFSFTNPFINERRCKN